MAKRRKIVRRATGASLEFSPAQLRKLRRLQNATDVAYRNFWVNAMGINRPPRPPIAGPLLRKLGQTVDYIMRILPPPRPPIL